MKMTMEQAFDEWIRKYEEDPVRFGNCMSAVKEYHERERGKVSNYGVAQARTLNGLMSIGKKHWDTIGL